MDCLMGAQFFNVCLAVSSMRCVEYYGLYSTKFYVRDLNEGMCFMFPVCIFFLTYLLFVEFSCFVRRIMILNIFLSEIRYF